MSRFDIVMSALRQRCLRMLPIGWRILQRRPPPDETVFAILGRVEIRQMPAGCFVGTCVNGEPAQARETALRRLTRYLNGENRGAAVLQAERPVIQQQVGPRRWRISVRLPTVPTPLLAPAPCAPKVKLWSEPSGWLAMVRMSGRPDRDTATGADAIVLAAIRDADWIATGAPMVRLSGSWFGRSFDVAVPVAPRCQGDERRPPWNACPPTELRQ